MTPEKRRVLVVTDSQINKNMLDDLLRDNYEADYSKDARETLDRLKASLLVPVRYSVMIINIDNSCSDAIELLKRIRSDETYKCLPIMVLTANCEDCFEAEALECNADEFMTLPLNSRIFLKRLKSLVELQDAFLRIRSLEVDNKTRLLTRQAFYERLPGKLAENPGKEFSLVVLSMERFHTINESYGYEEGDRFIISIAGLINDFVLEYGGMCARTDGTRFAVLIPHEEKVFDAYFDALNEYIVNYQNHAKVYLRFGIYYIKDPEENPYVVGHKAEVALKKAIESFDNIIVEYDESLGKKAEFESAIADDLSNALKNGDIKFYYQPKHNPSDGALAGAEALIRWEHPTLGFLYPGQFIPVLERNGLITELDLYVFEHVCMRVREWMDRYQRYTHISVNLSRKDFYRDDIADVLCSIAEKYDLEPKKIHIEVTESAYVEAPEKLMEVLKDINDRGFVFELDDFGTGYSSLSLLADMPIDIVKLDKAFVQMMDKSPQARRVVSFIISMVKWMNHYVVAEGVENEEQLNMLKSMDCNLIQGYYFSKPMPEEEFLEVLKSSRRTLERHTIDLIQSHGEIDDNKPTIMLVSSLALNSFSIRKALEESYNVLVTCYGNAALDYIRNEKSISAIVTEVPVNDMTGLEFSKIIKSDPSLAMIPVVFMCQADESMLVQAHDAGVDDVIFKPLDEKDVIFAVDRLINRNMDVDNIDDINIKNIKLMHNLASKDLITGLYNKEELKGNIEKRILYSGNDAFYFIIIDVDNLYENISGRDYRESDGVIKAVAERISKHFTNVDVLGRISGKRFAGYFRNDISEEEMQRRIRKMKRSLHFVIGDVEIRCNLGVSHYPDDGKTFDAIYDAAEKHVKHAKEKRESKSELKKGSP